MNEGCATAGTRLSDDSCGSSRLSLSTYYNFVYRRHELQKKKKKRKEHKTGHLSVSHKDKFEHKAQAIHEGTHYQAPYLV